MTNYIPPKRLKRPITGIDIFLPFMTSLLALGIGTLYLFMSRSTELSAPPIIFVIWSAIFLVLGSVGITYTILSLIKSNFVPQENKELAQAEVKLKESLNAQHGIDISLEEAQRLLFKETISLPGNATKWIKLDPNTGVFTVTTKTVTTEELTISQSAVAAVVEPKKVLPQELFAQAS